MLTLNEKINQHGNGCENSQTANCRNDNGEDVMVINKSRNNARLGNSKSRSPRQSFGVNGDGAIISVSSNDDPGLTVELKEIVARRLAIDSLERQDSSATRNSQVLYCRQNLRSCDFISRAYCWIGEVWHGLQFGTLVFDHVQGVDKNLNSIHNKASFVVWRVVSKRLQTVANAATSSS